MPINNNRSKSEELIARRVEDDKVLKDLFQEKYLRANATVAHRGKSGNNTSFTTVVTNEWAAQNLKLFIHMESAQRYVEIDDIGKVTLKTDEASVEEIKQRQPDYSRTQALSLYALTQPNRQFPTIMAVVEAPWVRDIDDDNYWDENGRAKQSVITPIFELDDAGKTVLLSNEQLRNTFVIDGSHRLIALQSINNVITTGTLPKYKKDGSLLGSKNISDVAADFNKSKEELFYRQVMEENISVQFFNAVEEKETYEEANRRVRSLFVHVNKTARKPTQGQEILLDDDGGYAITARKVGYTHPLFGKHTLGDRLETNNRNLPVNSIHISTLTILAETAEDYLGEFESDFGHWPSVSSKDISIRPDDNELDKARDMFKEYLDEVKKIKVFKDALASSDDSYIKNARNLYDDSSEEAKEATQNNNGHLLARPLGQRILANTIGKMRNEENPVALSTIFKKIRKFSDAGGFSHINNPKNIFYGLVWDGNNNKMKMTSKNAAIKLLIYMLRGQVDVDELTEAYQNARTNLGALKGGQIFWNSDGEKVDSKEQIELPDQISG